MAGFLDGLGGTIYILSNFGLLFVGVGVLVSWGEGSFGGGLIVAALILIGSRQLGVFLCQKAFDMGYVSKPP